MNRFCCGLAMSQVATHILLCRIGRRPPDLAQEDPDKSTPVGRRIAVACPTETSRPPAPPQNLLLSNDIDRGTVVPSIGPYKLLTFRVNEPPCADAAGNLLCVGALIQGTTTSIDWAFEISNSMRKVRALPDGSMKSDAPSAQSLSDALPDLVEYGTVAMGANGQITLPKPARVERCPTRMTTPSPGEPHI
jgi:hypothetical protein